MTRGRKAFFYASNKGVTKPFGSIVNEDSRCAAITTRLARMAFILRKVAPKVMIFSPPGAQTMAVGIPLIPCSLTNALMLSSSTLHLTNR